MVAWGYGAESVWGLVLMGWVVRVVFEIGLVSLWVVPVVLKLVKLADAATIVAGFAVGTRLWEG